MKKLLLVAVVLISTACGKTPEDSPNSFSFEVDGLVTVSAVNVVGNVELEKSIAETAVILSGN